MADYPSSSVAKRVSLGSKTVTSTGVGSVAYANLATQALPIQNGLLGNFSGALLIAKITTALTGAGGSCTVTLEGAADDPTDSDSWFTLSDIGDIVFDVDAGTNTLNLRKSLIVPGPLPQYVRAKFTEGGSVTAGVVAAEVVVHG